MYRGTHTAVPDERNEHDSPIARLQSVVRSSHRGGCDRDHADSTSALSAGALNNTGLDHLDRGRCVFHSADVFVASVV